MIFYLTKFFEAKRFADLPGFSLRKTGVTFEDKENCFVAELALEVFQKDRSRSTSPEKGDVIILHDLHYGIEHVDEVLEKTVVLGISTLERVAFGSVTRERIPK